MLYVSGPVLAISGGVHGNAPTSAFDRLGLLAFIARSFSTPSIPLSTALLVGLEVASGATDFIKSG